MPQISNVADYLFDKSAITVASHPEKLAGVFSDLIWTMSDNGEEISQATERWLVPDDVTRVRVALLLEGVFPFKDVDKMNSVLTRIKTRWPELIVDCDRLISERSSQADDFGKP
jgi:hypothetical protein